MNRGFTLVEALVAMAVLAVSLTPIFAQVTASFRLSRNIQESLTASMLAQEGIELVRGMRDDNWFRDDPFYTNIIECDAGCRVQVQTPPALCDYGPVGSPFCLMDDNGEVLLRDTAGAYQYQSGTPTPYKRTVRVTDLDPGDPDHRQLEILSTVTWESPGQPMRRVEVTGYLFDWLDF